MQQVRFQDLGRMDYQRAWDYQEKLLQGNVAVKTAIRNTATTAAETRLLEYPNAQTINVHQPEPVDDYTETVNYLLFVEHPPVYTLGKSGHEKNILITHEERERRNIAFFKTNRGGDITFHGPEQLVGYPILDLEKFQTDIGKYLRNLEEVIILTLDEYGVKGLRSPGETGVWLEAGKEGNERKICALGVRCSRWITMHGFAFNVNTDLRYFDHIVACGIQNKSVTSLQKELGTYVELEDVKEKVKKHFATVFDIRYR